LNDISRAYGAEITDEWEISVKTSSPLAPPKKEHTPALE